MSQTEVSIVEQSQHCFNYIYETKRQKIMFRKIAMATLLSLCLMTQPSTQCGFATGCVAYYVVKASVCVAATVTVIINPASAVVINPTTTVAAAEAAAALAGTVGTLIPFLP